MILKYRRVLKFFLSITQYESTIVWCIISTSIINPRSCLTHLLRNKHKILLTQFSSRLIKSPWLLNLVYQNFPSFLKNENSIYHNKKWHKLPILFFFYLFRIPSRYQFHSYLKPSEFPLIFSIIPVFFLPPISISFISSLFILNRAQKFSQSLLVLFIIFRYNIIY